MSDVARKVEQALERAFREHAAEAFSIDAAIVARVLIKHHGDDARRVAELAVKLLDGTARELGESTAGTIQVRNHGVPCNLDLGPLTPSDMITIGGDHG